MKNEDTKPKYVVIKEHIIRQIETHQHNPDFLKHPITEAALAEEWGVSRLTARHALKELEHEGLVHSIRGVGTLVSPNKVTGQLKSLERFYAEWALQGQDIRVDVLTLDHHYRPSVAVALKLQASLSDNVTYFERLRSIDGVPIVLDWRYIPAEIGSQVSEAQFRDRHLYEVVSETAGIQVGSARMEVEAMLANDDIAAKLNIDRKAPLLVRGVTICDKEERPIITGWSYYRADLYKYVVELP